MIAERKKGETNFSFVKAVDENIELYHMLNSDPEFDTLLLPCGKCVGCRLDYSRQWANRLQLESQLYNDNYFVTLTYDDDHLPFFDINGSNVPCLRKNDLQLFIKRLRSYMDYHFGIKFRFYACGEYGSNGLRPHYHLALLGCTLPDLDFWSRSKSGFPTFRSSILESCWSKGFVSVNPFSWETGAYIARYMLKKQKGDDNFIFKVTGFPQEFSLMSRSPGIGKPYFDLHYQDIYKFDSITVFRGGKGVTERPPAYFDSLYSSMFPDDFLEVQRKRREISNLSYYSDFVSHNSSLNHYDQRLVDERAKIDSIHALRRSFEEVNDIL